METINSAKAYLTDVAMNMLNYGEALKIDSRKQVDVLARIYTTMQDEIKDLSPQELALAVTYIRDVKSENYDEYIKVFGNKPLLYAIIENTDSLNKQVDMLDEVENLYFEWDINFNNAEQLCDFLNKRVHYFRIENKVLNQQK